jgi:predicted metalloendopeptidase
MRRALLAALAAAGAATAQAGVRVRGVIANMPEFARAFSCEPGKVLLAEEQRGDIW